MVNSGFVHLHTHSHFSLEDGVPSVQELVREAASSGFTSLALTDHNTLAGIPAFTEACFQFGIRPIIGCEINILPFRIRVPAVGAVGGTHFHHATLLVQNKAGFFNLTRLVNRANRSALHEALAISFADLEECSEGLVFLSGCQRGELFHLLKMARIEETEEYLQRLISIFGRNRVFFELQMEGSERERIINGRIVQLAGFLEVGIVATNNVHYILPEDEAAYLCLCGRETLLEAGATTPFGEILSPKGFTRHLATEEEMRQKFFAHPQAIENTCTIAASCEFSLDDLRAHPMPHLPLHDFVRGQDADSFLWDRVFEAATRRYGTLSTKIKDRLNEEFETITRCGMAHYLVFLHYVADFFSRNGIHFIFRHECLNTSLIAHLLLLLEIDPVKYHIRFQAPGEGDGLHAPLPKPWSAGDPGAMFEIPSAHLEKTIAHIIEMFPPSSLCYVGHLITWQRNTLLAHITRWATLSPEDSEFFLKESAERKPLTLQEYANFIRENRDRLSLCDGEFLFALFSRLYPRPRSLQAKQGVLAFSSQDIEAVLPCMRIGENQVSEFEEELIDTLGLHLIKLTSNAVLDVLDTAVRWVTLQGNPQFSQAAVDLADIPTYDLLAQGLTEGIPPFESITVKSLLRKGHPTSFLELVKILMEATAQKDSPKTLTSVISNCLVGFRCSYIKAHYRASFMTAALTHVCGKLGNMERYISLVRQTKRLGVKLKPPSINESEYEFSQEGEGIRTGLMVVRLMGEKACEEIIRVRKGGSFENLLDLCQRVDSRLLNYPLLENLIKAGVLDCFSLRRAQLLQILDNTIGYSKSQKVEGDATIPLFGDEEAQLFNQPPEIPEFSPEELMRMEIETTGAVVTRYPLEPYLPLLQQMGALSMTDLSTKQAGMEKFIGGFIDHIDMEGPFIAGDTVMVLDFEGIHVRVGAEVGKRYESAIRINLPVVIGGIVERIGEFPALSATCAFPLEHLSAQVRSLRKVVLDCTGPPAITYDALKRVHRLLKRYPGETAVEILNVPEGGGRLARKIATMNVFFCPPLYFDLTRLLPAQAIKAYTAAPTPDDTILQSW
jgi:DNA polymerase III alpha subunit